ncbi:hypothetical protein [Mitsuaria sp. 7]|uniref:hypothetical protein n=1 Tax=Mitsuaria sp. 7 TaxID=1658665 RepID=UPI0012F9B583|nr:hypothetical protein [Mitsuaria sp. 7]
MARREQDRDVAGLINRELQIHGLRMPMASTRQTVIERLIDVASHPSPSAVDPSPLRLGIVPAQQIHEHLKHIVGRPPLSTHVLQYIAICGQETISVELATSQNLLQQLQVEQRPSLDAPALTACIVEIWEMRETGIPKIRI